MSANIKARAALLQWVSRKEAKIKGAVCKKATVLDGSECDGALQRGPRSSREGPDRSLNNGEVSDKSEQGWRTSRGSLLGC